MQRQLIVLPLSVSSQHLFPGDRPPHPPQLSLRIPAPLHDPVAHRAVLVGSQRREVAVAFHRAVLGERLAGVPSTTEPATTQNTGQIDSTV
jgi:hypothetical protein